MIRKKTIDLNTVLLSLLDGEQFTSFIIMKPLYYTPADVFSIFPKYKQKHCMKKVHVQV